jgi:hypothetical protein
MAIEIDHLGIAVRSLAAAWAVVYTHLFNPPQPAES